MRGLALIALFGACTFTPGRAADPGGAGTGGQPGGSAPDAAPIAWPACDITDSSIQLCLDFEMPQQLGLDSSAGQHDAMVTSATPVPRTSEQAVSVAMGSTIHVAETPALDIQDTITYELWLNPTSVPAANTHYTSLENHGQYWTSVEDDGRVRCYIAGKYAESVDPIPVGEWTHVACTYDRAMITIYINGDASNCYQTSGQISTTGTSGTKIGEPFIGAIDNVHIFSREVLPTEICAHAGRSGCDAACVPE